MNLYGHSTLSSQRTLEVLSASPMYRDYERAFTEGTGLPLRLQGPGLLHVVRYAKKQENPFSALMAAIDRNCTPSSAQCYALQCRLEDEAQFAPRTLKGFAGLCETVVPVRVGEVVIAFLHTGQVLLQRPDKVKFKLIAATLLKWGAEVDLAKLEECYFSTRVLTLKQYDALIGLLTAFAGQLASCCRDLILQAQQKDSSAIGRARALIATSVSSKTHWPSTVRTASTF